MDDPSPAPETKVLAIASHVVHGYVGNKVATFVMQSLGLNVSAINTVNYSNHTGYKQVKGTKVTAEQIQDLYEGLKQSYLDEFDMMLSGYLPSPEAIQAVGKIGRGLQLKTRTRPGAFFWVLDPVMGDGGRFYVPEASVPVYKSLLRDCDLILPNQFELEALSDTKISTMASLAVAIHKMHTQYQLPHVFVTSTHLSESADSESDAKKITVVGSTARADRSLRLFRIDVPYYPVYFTGTGDMLAALLVARFREAAAEAKLLKVASWISPDDVAPTELPLAKAAEKVVASMQAILSKTYRHFLQEKEKLEDPRAGLGGDEEEDSEESEDREKKLHLLLTKAVELRLVRNVGDIIRPEGVEKYKAMEVMLDGNRE